MIPLNNIEKYLQDDNKEIKVSLKDISYLFEQLYNNLAETNKGIEEEDISKIEYLFNKYLVCAKLRKEEALWYNIIKQIDEGKMKEIPKEKRQESRREAYGFYIEEKTKREKLQESLKNESGI